MFSKFTVLLLFLIFTLSSCAVFKKRKNYPLPKIEDCTVITKWSLEAKTDVATCFCIDDKLTKDTFSSLVVERVNTVMKNHPAQAESLVYLEKNKKEILKYKEYELPISYCRGYSALSPNDRKLYFLWAESNRLERIRCEVGN